MCGGRWLQGMGKALGDVLPDEEFKGAEQIKTRGHAMYEPEVGGRYDVWRQRPLNIILKLYCALDVGHLFTMLDSWGESLPRDVLRWVSEQRAGRQIAEPFFTKGSHR